MILPSYTSIDFSVTYRCRAISHNISQQSVGSAADNPITILFSTTTQHPLTNPFPVIIISKELTYRHLYCFPCITLQVSKEMDATSIKLVDCKTWVGEYTRDAERVCELKTEKRRVGCETLCSYLFTELQECCTEKVHVTCTQK